MKRNVLKFSLLLIFPFAVALLSCDDDNERDYIKLYSNEACQKSELPHPHFINLALPSGTLWACCNLGAHGTADEGVRYAWGETSVKDSVYCWKNSLYYITEKGLCERIGDTGSISGTEYDAAKSKWGASFLMPSSANWEELLKYCTASVSTGQNGQIIVTFTGRNGNYITLPIDEGHGYWSSDQNRLGHDNYALALTYQPGANNVFNVTAAERCLDFHIRPIASGKYTDLEFVSLWDEKSASK